MAINPGNGSGEISYDGSPFSRITAKAGIGNNTLELSYDGAPWWMHEVSASAVGHIKSVNDIPWEHIKSFNGVDQVHIKTIINVEG